jgi:hypothetical protein
VKGVVSAVFAACAHVAPAAHTARVGLGGGHTHTARAAREEASRPEEAERWLLSWALRSAGNSCGSQDVGWFMRAGFGFRVSGLGFWFRA